MTVRMILGLILVLAFLIVNTMIAIAFLRGRADVLKSVQGRDREAMDELHRRVESLRPTDK